MNNRMKEIATETLNMNNFEKWMDADKQMVLKSTAVDILDHFGL